MAGYLCSLCTFEWTMLWGFAPFVFRPQVAALLSLAFVGTLALHQMPRAQRSPLSVPALAWLAVAAWPLRLSAITATVIYSGLLLLLLLGTADARRSGMALVLGLILALALLCQAPLWPVALLVSLLAAVEIRSSGRQDGGFWPALSAPAARRRLEADADSRTAEIAWKGFAALYKAAAPGEGERFTTSVLADTTRIIEGCEGRRVRGSDLNGLYRFPNQDSLDRCLEHLERYRLSIGAVLREAQAPPLELAVVRAGEAPTPSS